MKTTKSNNKTNLLVMFICTMIVLAAITIANYSSRKEIKKQVQEQEQNDYSDALIKSCEPYNK